MTSNHDMIWTIGCSVLIAAAFSLSAAAAAWLLSGPVAGWAVLALCTALWCGYVWAIRRRQK